jgi:RNA recognition motif-containing protein
LWATGVAAPANKIQRRIRFMTQKVYIGNLPYRTTKDDLHRFLKKYEPIHSLILITDKETEQLRGYGFVELDESKAYDALYELRGTAFNGRKLIISIATGRVSKSNAPEDNTLREKLMENKSAATRTALRRGRNLQTRTEYMVADVNNYG